MCKHTSIEKGLKCTDDGYCPLCLRAELEVERMRLAACGVVANANTPESAREARQMNEKYRSASCNDVARAVDMEMALRAELGRIQAKLDDHDSAEQAHKERADYLEQQLAIVKEGHCLGTACWEMQVNDLKNELDAEREAVEWAAENMCVRNILWTLTADEIRERARKRVLNERD